MPSVLHQLNSSYLCYGRVFSILRDPLHFKGVGCPHFRLALIHLFSHAEQDMGILPLTLASFIFLKVTRTWGKYRSLADLRFLLSNIKTWLVLEFNSLFRGKGERSEVMVVWVYLWGLLSGGVVLKENYSCVYYKDTKSTCCRTCKWYLSPDKFVRLIRDF